MVKSYGWARAREANVLSQRLGVNTFEIMAGVPLLLSLSFEAGILTREEIEEDVGLPTPIWLGGTASNHEFLTVSLRKIADGESPYAEGTARFTEHFGKKLASGEKLVDLYEELYTANGYARAHN